MTTARQNHQYDDDVKKRRQAKQRIFFFLKKKKEKEATNLGQLPCPVLPLILRREGKTPAERRQGQSRDRTGGKTRVVLRGACVVGPPARLFCFWTGLEPPRSRKFLASKASCLWLGPSGFGSVAG